MFPTNNQDPDRDMFNSAVEEDCDKKCKKPCMDIIADSETYYMDLESCDLPVFELPGDASAHCAIPGHDVFLMNQEGPQEFQQGFLEPSTWEMDLVSALDEDMVTSQPYEPAIPDYPYPNDDIFLPFSQQSQNEDDLYRPREPFAAADCPQPGTQADYPPPWFGEMFPNSNGATALDQIYESSEVVFDDPFGHEQWAYTETSPMTTSHQYAGFPLNPETLPGMGVTLGTPMSDSFPDAYQIVAEDPQNPSTSGAEWEDDATYRGIPPQARDMFFYTLLQLNDSFADLVYLQWLEVAEEYAFRPCRDVFAEYPTIRGLATMFNLRLSEDEDADGEEEEEEVAEQKSSSPATHAENEDGGCDSEGHASLATTAGELDDDVEMED
ncbi:hypothetical protein PG984_014737 [Apiospora sp. TS-2023a]